MGLPFPRINDIQRYDGTVGKQFDGSQRNIMIPNSMELMEPVGWPGDMAASSVTAPGWFQGTQGNVYMIERPTGGCLTMQPTVPLLELPVPDICELSLAPVQRKPCNKRNAHSRSPPCRWCSTMGMRSLSPPGTHPYTKTVAYTTGLPRS